MSTTIDLPCPHCTTLNRLPRERLDDRPACGRCHKALFGAHPVELTDATFAAVALRGDVPVLVDFWAPWCGPCLAFAPVYADAARRHEPRLRLAKVDTDANPHVARQFDIRSIPTLALLHRGREVARQSGAMDAGSLARWIAQATGGLV
ncbi:MAG TPA: thioredoxin TrxC [Tahibacter sp.]|nr:thioredoxin TrxC [Tahibacter sp.]